LPVGWFPARAGIQDGVMEAEVGDVRRHQPPPLTGRDVRAVVPQQVGRGCSAQLR
jgi:hypothetical protein